MSKLGSRQLEHLALMAHVGCAQVVPDDMTRSLCKRGLMVATGNTPELKDACIVITPDGFRALADAMDAGLVEWKPDWKKLRGARAK